MISTAQSYKFFHNRLDNIFTHLRHKVPGFFGYSSGQVAARLVQRIAELGVFEFTRLAAIAYNTTGNLPAEDQTIVCAGIRMESNGKIYLLPINFMPHFLKFIAHWIYTFLKILLAIKPFAPKRKISLLYGVGFQDLISGGSDTRFLNFCRNGHLQPLGTSRYLAIQSVMPILSTKPLEIKYGRDPLILVLEWTGLEIMNWLYALGQHVTAGVSFLRAVIMEPTLILLGADFSRDAVARALSRQHSLGDVLITNSNYFSQSLWMWALPRKRHTFHLVWYSQNNYPISYFDEKEAIPIPNLRYIRADIQWVWTNSFKDFLEKICTSCVYKVVPPIVWQLPSEHISFGKRWNRIVLFDITPLNQATELRLGLLRNFYTEKNMIKLLDDVIEVTKTLSKNKKIRLEIILKHKRNHADVHSSKYIDFVKALSVSGDLILEESDANIYDLIYESDMVITAPYSSPVYIANYLGKHAIWYDPSDSLEWKLQNIEVPLVKGFDSLLKEIDKVF
jgi:polysaccharide biosynthesis PFTS motif protein